MNRIRSRRWWREGEGCELERRVCVYETGKVDDMYVML
jgi:hypothetical protein